MNLYACLVHERRDCVLDLVRNLRHLDPVSPILLYDGGTDPDLLGDAAAWTRLGAVLHPSPRPMRWGQLHDFALDSMRFGLAHLPFDTLTIVDSDQLGARAGYVERLGAFLATRPAAGLLGSAPPPGPATRLAAPAQQARRELDLWRPFLRRFPGGEAKFPQWTFWPSTVFTSAAARALVDLWDRDRTLPDLLRRSQMWATEEVLLPTLVALLGLEVCRSPCSYDYVRFRARYTPGQLEAALAHPEVFWLHPIPRRLDDPLRRRVRDRLGAYGSTPPPPGLVPPEAAPPVTPVTPAMLAEVRAIEGWLTDEEAGLLAEAAAAALAGLETPRALVEVGSYCGKATVLLGRVAERLGSDAVVHAIDPHDGKVGAVGQRVHETGPTRHKLERNLATAGLQGRVRVHQCRAPEVAWQGPIALLLIDGLHDYESASRDFRHLERHVVEGGCVLFHDDAHYFPGVRRVVEEAVRSGRYALRRRAGSMTQLVRSAGRPARPEPSHPPAAGAGAILQVGAERSP